MTTSFVPTNKTAPLVGVCEIVNGGLLNVPPLKIYLASEPGAGRIWRRLTAAEAAEHATAALAKIEGNAT